MSQRRTDILEALNKVQIHLCAYRSSSFCDCKFGATNVGQSSEEGNGCPEVRTAIHILKNMSDQEFDYFRSRSIEEMKNPKKQVLPKGPVISKFDVVVTDMTNH